MPRPRFQAPPGRLTIREAATRARISYRVAYARIVVDAVVPHERSNGVCTIAAADAEKLRTPKSKPQDPRVAVQVRVQPREYRAFKRGAKDAGFKAVSSWLIDLGRKAVGGGEQ